MKKIILALVVAAGLMGLSIAPAAAQDQTLTVDPGSVEAAGEYEFTVVGEGFTVPVFLLPCPGAEGDPAALATGEAADLCDTSKLTPVTPDDAGRWEATVTYEVGDSGLVLVAGDQAQTNSAVGVVTVGAAEEAPAEEAPAEEAEEPLANTGVESGLLAIIGLSVALAGAMILFESRRTSQA